MKHLATIRSILAAGLWVAACSSFVKPKVAPDSPQPLRLRRGFNDGWRFYKYASVEEADGLIYDQRPQPGGNSVAAANAAEGPAVVGATASAQGELRPWILPTGNDFLGDSSQRHSRPPGSPGSDFPFVQKDFEDGSWEAVRLPHDWAIKGPFLPGPDAAVGGGMGRLPSPGVAWYRKAFEVPSSAPPRRYLLEVDGAMSYAMVWLNGQLVGGWPYGYASWQVDLTPFIVPGSSNQLAIRLDNPAASSRWYPGGGLYRNVWLTETHPVHVSQWGTFITTPKVSEGSAELRLTVTIDNDSKASAAVGVATLLYTLGEGGQRSSSAVGRFEPKSAEVAARGRASVELSAVLESPLLWGPPPDQTPHRYAAVTTLSVAGKPVDAYETRFGIRELRFDPNAGVFVNGQHVRLRGVNQHHDLGALGAAFNERAAERQLELLAEMGCNAIRLAHNPPAPELLELTDRMGFVVIDETFDVWRKEKTPLDFHRIFADWHEQDTRALVRRDRNHPSVIAWSLGNEVGEQYSGDGGAAIARRLRQITREEDPTRPTTTSMNFAKPDMELPAAVDMVSLNYQGEGIRNAPGYAHLEGITTPPLYGPFHEALPDKLLVSSENAAALSTRGAYLFPVFSGPSAPVENGSGGDPITQQVSAYELYTANFGSSADKVFASLDQHPFVAGGFVWSGWDYLGEPTPYYGARSSYFGIIDLAGFKKDRFYLYQSRWRPGLPMAHIAPHWTWPERVGQVTPVHVFTTGEEAELFVNGRSLGRRKKGQYEYRLRWDDVHYEPGELRAVAYREGQPWAEERVHTVGPVAGLLAASDRSRIAADGRDLAFVTVRVVDDAGRTAPRAHDLLEYSLEGPGEIVATDNGDPTDFTSFASHRRRAFHGLGLAIVRGRAERAGTIELTVRSGDLAPSTVRIETVSPEN